jgi:anti-sigma B factor antagonist
MLLKTEHFNSVLVVMLPTDVDAANAMRVGEELVARATHSVSCLVVDLTETRYLDSAGLDMLFRLRARMRQRRKEVHLLVPPDSPLRRLLEIVSVEAADIPVHASVEEAVEAAAAMLRVRHS